MGARWPGTTRLRWRRPWGWSGLLLLLLIPSPATGASLSDTIDRVRPSIVAVGTYQKTRSPAFAFRGTGFAIGDGSVVATNAHVVPADLAAQQKEMLVVVTMVGGAREPRQATQIAVSAGHDLALLRITGPPLPPMQLSENAAVREGQMFAFTGFPIGSVLGLVPVTHRGMISAITPIALPTATAQQLDPRVIRRVKEGVFPVFQLDATAYPGNSGSPMYDIETGHVVAIVNMVAVRSTRESGLTQPSGITFAIPVRHLRDLMAATP